MTDRAAPGAQGSTVRNVEFGEMGGVPAPFIVPNTTESESWKRWDELDDKDDFAFPERGPFAYGGKTGDDNIGFQGGEAYANGWFGVDEELLLDISPYEGEFITVVVGWDPDAVYSSDIHDTREEADRVFVDVEREVDNKPYIPLVEGPVIEDGEGGYVIDFNEVVDLRPIGRPVETLPSSSEKGTAGSDQENSKGPGVNLLRGRPTTFTGAVNTGPHETPVNAERTVHAFAPVDADAEPGTEAEYHDLDVAGTPAGRYQYSHREGGGAYGTQFDSGLGRVARLNANLLWEYDEFADVPHWDSDATDASIEFALEGFPRQASVRKDSTSDIETGGIRSEVTTAAASLGNFSVTFKSITSDATDPELCIGLTTADASQPMNNNGSGYVVKTRGTNRFQLVDEGELTDGSTVEGGDIDFSEPRDLTFMVYDDVVRLYLDGEYGADVENNISDELLLHPAFQIESSEIENSVVVEEVTVEVIE